MIATPFFDCRLIDLTGAKRSSVGFLSIIGGSIDLEPTCQNLTDVSWDAEIKVLEEENIREVITWVWPMKASTSWGSEAAIF